MKKYTFEVVIEEGNDEFWEGVDDVEYGAEELCHCLQRLLDEHGFAHENTTVKVKDYEH